MQRRDANKDGNITITDAMFIAQYKLGSSYKYYKNLTDIEGCLDVSNDGNITITDAMFIAQYKLGSSYKYYKNLTTYQL